MYTKSHQGVVKETVLLEFENNYSITLDKGVEMAMHLVMPEEADQAHEIAELRAALTDALAGYNHNQISIMYPEVIARLAKVAK